MPRRTWLGLGLVTALAAGLRFYRLDSLPPGLWFDEAWASVQARDLIAQHTFPIYFPADFGGLHPAIVYLTVIARAVMGGHPLAIRYGVAALGVLSVPSAFFALRAIFHLDEDTAPHRNTLALLGAFILAITFPYLLLSRIGFEVILPSVAGLGVSGVLARAARTHHLRDYALAGAALGLALYTYLSARLLPVAVVMAFIWLALITRAWKKSITGLAIVATASLIVFAPFGLYFLQHPDLFFARAGVTSYNTLGPGARSVPLALLTNLARTLAGFSLPGFGDGLARHNLPGAPFYDVFLSVLFWLGVLAALLQPRRHSSALLLGWGLVMLLPTLLTDNAPAFTRMMTAVPAFTGLVALGGWTFYRALAAQHRPFALSVLALGLAFSMGTTLVNYFGRWANHPALYDAFQQGDWDAAQLAEVRLKDGAVYLSPDLISDAHPTFDLLLTGKPVRAFTGPACLVYEEHTTNTYVVEAMSEEGRATATQLTALFPAGQWDAPILHQPEPFPLFHVFTVPPTAEAAVPPVTITATFGEVAQLLGYALVPNESALTLTLYWKSLAPTVMDYTAFLHLAAPEAMHVPPIAQDDARPCAGDYPTPQWYPGEVVLDTHTLSLPDSLAPGSYALLAGMYDLASGARLPVAPGEADRALLALIEIK